jgi:hypothetical protein
MSGRIGTLMTRIKGMSTDFFELIGLNLVEADLKTFIFFIVKKLKKPYRILELSYVSSLFSLLFTKTDKNPVSH